MAARKELARRLDQRVEARREQSGNAALSGRELDTADVIAAKAHIDAVALKLRDAGLDGPLGRLRALALTDLTQGRNPLDRINPAPATATGTAPPDNERPDNAPDDEPAGATPPDNEPPDDEPADVEATNPSGARSVPPDGPAGDPSDTAAGPARPAGPAPLPALINLLVPAGTLLGWGTAPACNAQAIYCDLDHTVPYPDGSTRQCNLTPKCRRHHRTKQAPGWNVTQPNPGTTTWTTPSGRTHHTTPTVYDL